MDNKLTYLRFLGVFSFTCAVCMACSDVANWGWILFLTFVTLLGELK